MRRRKKGNGTVQSANPDFGCAGVEIEDAFFVDLGNGVGGGIDLDADLGSALEQGQLADILGAPRGEPGNVDGFHAAGGRKRALRHDFSVRQQSVQKNADIDLALAMKRSWRRTHEDVAMLIGFNAIRESGEGGISQDLGPAREIKLRLRIQVR